MAELSRHPIGRQRFAKVIDLWVRQSGLSNAWFCKAAELSLGSNRLHPTQLSGLRQGVQNQISVYTFEGFGALSKCAYAYHEEKRVASKKRFADGLHELLEVIPPLIIEEDFTDTEHFINLFLGLTPVVHYELPSHWLGADWSIAVNDLHAPEEPEEEEIEENTLGEGLRIILSTLPGQLDENITKLIGCLSENVPTDRQNQIRLVALNFPGANEFSPDSTELESATLSMALTKLTGKAITAQDLKRAARINQADTDVQKYERAFLRS